MANDLHLRVLLSAIDRATAPLRRIMQGSDATARALKATRERLKQLNAQQSDVRAFRTQRGALEQVSTALAAQQARVKALAQQMAAAGNPTRALTRDYNRAIREAGFLKQQHLQHSHALQQLRTRLSNAGISTRNLGQHERDLRAQIQAANGAINSQAQRLRNLSQQQERLTQARNTYSRGIQSAAALAGTGMAARATGMYTGDKLRQMLGVGYEFDATMSATQAVTRIERKDDPQMQALRQQARTLPLSSKFTDKEVAQGQYFLGRTGYNAKQILGAMPGMLNLAAAGDMDLGDTADIASNIQTAMGIPAEKMDQVADVLTAAFTRNNVDIRMLGDSLKYSAGVGREYGQSLETVTAATALLGNAGVQGSQAGTSMRSVLTRLGLSKAVAQLGVKTQDANGNMRDMLDILKDINDKTKKMGNIQRGAIYKDIAGQYAVTAFGTLMRAVESGQFQSMRGSLDNSEGEAARVASTQLDNLKGDMTMLHAALENISVELFDKNSPWLRELGHQSLAAQRRRAPEGQPASQQGHRHHRRRVLGADGHRRQPGHHPRRHPRPDDRGPLHAQHHRHSPARSDRPAETAVRTDPHAGRPVDRPAGDRPARREHRAVGPGRQPGGPGNCRRRGGAGRRRVPDLSQLGRRQGVPARDVGRDPGGPERRDRRNHPHHPRLQPARPDVPRLRRRPGLPGHRSTGTLYRFRQHDRPGPG
ncbi:phage tail tape measure protein [Pseudomonas aeruginosa]